MADLQIRDAVAAEPYEYLCFACGQLRYSECASDTCANCGSANIRKGALGSLDKSMLLEITNDDS